MDATQLERGMDHASGTETARGRAEDHVPAGPPSPLSIEGDAKGCASDDLEEDAASERLDALSPDSIFEILSNSRRRSTIVYLNRTGDETVQLRDLAEQIAAWENGVAPEEVTYKERKRVYTSLYQSHLEKMDRLGLIEYDRNRGTVEPTEATEEIEEYLESVNGDGGSPRYAPLGVAIGSVAFVLGAWTGALPFGPLDGFAVAFVVAYVFLAVSGVTVLLDR